MFYTTEKCQFFFCILEPDLVPAANYDTIDEIPGTSGNSPIHHMPMPYE